MNWTALSARFAQYDRRRLKAGAVKAVLIIVIGLSTLGNASLRPEMRYLVGAALLLAYLPIAWGPARVVGAMIMALILIVSGFVSMLMRLPAVNEQALLSLTLAMLLFQAVQEQPDSGPPERTDTKRP